jgi:hypothetical protein
MNAAIDEQTDPPWEVIVGLLPDENDDLAPEIRKLFEEDPRVTRWIRLQTQKRRLCGSYYF